MGMRLDEDVVLAIGRLGRFTLPAGYYVYAGSARGPGGLSARLARHRRREKRFHWHVDYLLARAHLIEVWTAVSMHRLECIWAKAILEMVGARVIAPRFGASDCCCPAHLIYFAQRPADAGMTATLQNCSRKEVMVEYNQQTHWLQILIGGDEDARQEAADALGALGEASVSPLLALLDDGDADVRCWASWALAQTGSRRAVQPLMAALDDAECDVRIGAALALGELGAAEAAPALVAQLASWNGLLSRCAAAALEKIGQEAAPALVEALEHPKSQVRMWAARALRCTGSMAAVESLCRVYLYDESYLARHYAEEALREMGVLEMVLVK